MVGNDTKLSLGHGRCLVLVLGLAISLTSASSASATIYCVQDPACVSAGGTGKATLQQAFDAADADPIKDRVEIGPVALPAGGTADDTNPVEVIGEGSGAGGTSITGGTTVLDLEHAESTASDLAIIIPDINSARGLRLNGGSANNVHVTGSGTSAWLGAYVTGSGALRNSTVDLLNGPGSTGVYAGPDVVVEGVTVQADTGIVGILTARRVQVVARTIGIGSDSHFGDDIVVDHATVRMLTAAGTALSAVPSSGGFDPVGVLTARHVTAIGSGGGTGASAVSNCDFLGGIRPASIVLRNTILRGFETDLRREGTTCNGTPAPATIDAAYSIFDPAKVVESGAGSLIQPQPNYTLDPLFFDPAAGDFHLPGGSPAIDLGDPAVFGPDESTVDLDGRPRVLDGDGDGTAVRDIGAYEHQIFDRKLRIAYRKNRFKGKLRSQEPGCWRGKVKDFEKARGKDPKVGSDRTSATGAWSVREKEAEGKFYATTRATQISGGTCPAVKSKTIRVR